MSNKIQPSFNIKYKRGKGAETFASSNNLLAAIGFSDTSQQLSDDKPIFTVASPELEEKSTVEVWQSYLPVEYKQDNDIVYSANGEVLFGHILLDEANFSGIKQATEYAYRSIFNLIKTAGYDCLIRIWNYFPQINQHDEELERYRSFCLGRQHALNAFGNFSYSPPAATAIGTFSKGLQVYFIAAKSPGIQLENPRQTSAFLYPKKYGPVSPSFSRATVKRWGNHQHIYISGTASIVGHQSLHDGDLEAQINETCNNINALIQHGDETLSLSINQIHQLSLMKVYLRSPALLPHLKKAMLERFQCNLPEIIYLHGDVCRSDLLVEIEAIYA